MVPTQTPSITGVTMLAAANTVAPPALHGAVRVVGCGMNAQLRSTIPISMIRAARAAPAEGGERDWEAHEQDTITKMIQTGWPPRCRCG
jgi:hypothetical protein